eukprot:Em1344g1a
MHCMAHRLELGFKAVVGENSFMTTFSELLFSIYNFYHSSALNRENLKSSCAAAEAVEYVSSPNAALRAGAGVSSDSKAKAKGFFKKLSCKKTVLLGAFVTDVVDTLHSVSLAMQSPSYSPGHIIGTLKSTMAKLQANRELKADMKCLVDGLTAQLEKRLGENGTDDVTKFGNQDVALLLRHFGPILEKCGVDVSVDLTEWNLLKDIVSYQRSLSGWMCSGRPKTIVQMCSSWWICFSPYLPAVQIVNEGSVTKVIKSDWRSRLRDTMVTDLMTVQLHSPEIGDFDPASSILTWKGTCKRRLSLNISDSNSDDEMESE